MRLWKWLKMPPAFEMLIGGGVFTIIALIVGLSSAGWAVLMGIVAVMFIAHGTFRGLGRLRVIRETRNGIN